MKKKIQISSVALARIPKYLRILKNEREKGLSYISSTFIANELNFTSIQVRKDLALISKCNGKPGKGFEINKLISDIEEFLGINSIRKAVIIGAGRVGQALANYQGFENNVDISVMFDNDKRKCNNKNIFCIDKLQEYITEENVEIGIITVPKNNAQEVCDLLVKYGIKAIWNFAPINLKVPEGIAIKNEDLSSSLSILLKNM